MDNLLFYSIVLPFRTTFRPLAIAEKTKTDCQLYIHGSECIERCWDTYRDLLFLEVSYIDDASGQRHSTQLQHLHPPSLSWFVSNRGLLPWYMTRALTDRGWGFEEVEQRQ